LGATWRKASSTMAVTSCQSTLRVAEVSRYIPSHPWNTPFAEVGGAKKRVGRRSPSLLGRHLVPDTTVRFGRRRCGCRGGSTGAACRARRSTALRD
jgi:hypothetical protein